MALTAIPVLNREGRITIVHQDKSIDSAFKTVITQPYLFINPMHVKRNMTPLLVAEKRNGVALYKITLHAASVEELEQMKGLYGPRQRFNLSKYADV